jgi:hypothetical protein
MRFGQPPMAQHNRHCISDILLRLRAPDLASTKQRDTDDVFALADMHQSGIMQAAN